MDASALMVTYKGKGDKFYGEYTRLVGKLDEACSAADPDEAVRMVQVISDLKDYCHKAYK